MYIALKFNWKLTVWLNKKIPSNKSESNVLDPLRLKIYNIFQMEISFETNKHFFLILTK